uniref:Thioredoxin reductase n=1 Tax=Rhodosorus marinus TaxID=101924 RepID=A0A7S3EK23_9RHOD
MVEEEPQVENVVIVGSGPAAHTAAIYTARAELKPLLFEGLLAGGVAAGGQLTTTTDVENFPGFPDGISGMEITERFRAQSINMGTRILTETISSVDFGSFPYEVTSENGTVVRAKALVIASGATAKRMDIPGAGDNGFWQRGVSACAVCDGAAPFFRGKPLAVIGGGDSAMEEATFLTKYGSKVYVVVRRDVLRASKTMQQRARANPKIEFLYSHAVTEALGSGKFLEQLKIKDLKTEEERIIDCNGLFFAIGHLPNTQFVSHAVDTDDQGYIITKPDSTATNVRGVFACGDCQDKKWRQAITAAGSGCMSALEVEHYLQELEDDQPGTHSALNMHHNL